MTNTRMGRRSIFRGKVGGHRVQSVLSDTANEGFETARLQLGALYLEVYGVAADVVSDADTIEYQFRGHVASRLYLREQARTHNGPNGGNRSAQPPVKETGDDRHKDYQKGARPQNRA